MATEKKGGVQGVSSALAAKDTVTQRVKLRRVEIDRDPRGQWSVVAWVPVTQ